MLKKSIIQLFGIFLLNTAFPQGLEESWIHDKHGAIVRGDPAHKNVALVFSGDEFGEGTDTILNTLKAYDVQASFFLTGTFYTNPQYKSSIEKILAEEHYLGLHTETSIVLVDSSGRLLTSESAFRKDLKNNFRHLADFGIKKSDVLYFIPPCSCYDSTVVAWCKSLGYPLVYGSPGTLISADHTYPNGPDLYRSSEEIYHSILRYELTHQHGLNGYILLMRLGADDRRPDKFYFQLSKLIEHLDHRGYNFVELHQLLD